MNKEEKVISLKLAQELQKVAKEKGLKLPESEYKIFFDDEAEEEIVVDRYFSKYRHIKKYPAYNTAELGEILPYFVTMEKDKKWLVIEHKGYKIEAKTEAGARCKMLIYLIKNNKIK